jgi:molecular chaperone DnaK
VAFGFQRGFLAEGGTSRQRLRILVYDLGGGTFDVTVMEITGRDFVALATDGDVRLGGRDWDQRLVDCVAEDFVRKHGVDPREDPNVEGRMWRECEDAKRTLSVRSHALITSEFGGHVARLDMTRAQFEEMTLDLLERTAFTTRQTLQAAGLDWSQIDRILLVGGATRMPAVVRMLRELSGQDPDQSVSPDEAVAHGAALHAGLLLARHAGQAPRFQIRNVNSHSLGVVANDPQTSQLRNAILIPRNTPLPADARRIFKTHKRGQKSILVQIVEGESAAPDDCAPVGRCSVRDLPADLPAQTPIEVGFRYLDNGRLSVQVKVAGTNTRLEHEIMRENSLTTDQLNSWRKYVSGLPPVARVISDGVAAP